MVFFSFLSILSFFLVLLCAYLFININAEIITIDLLFLQLQLGIGSALLIFLLAGSLLTVFIEILVFNKKRNTGE